MFLFIYGNLFKREFIHLNMKIAVVGGGIFGLTIATLLGKEGFSVDVFEKEKDVFLAASGSNQFRLHRGYHYPRSMETITDCLSGEKKFREFYPEAIIDSDEHYYAIAKEGSFLNVDQYFKVWSDYGLEYELADIDILNKDKIEACVRVKESLINPKKLKKTCLEKCKKYGVNIFLGKKVDFEDLNDYDLIVNATYSLNNHLLDRFKDAKKNYQFELIEKLVLKLPKRFKNKSVVIVDGDFTCIDPYGETDFTLMGNVVHAIHHRNIGKFPEIPLDYKELLNKGIVKNLEITKKDKFLDFAEKFFPGIKDEAEYIGSFFTVRTVLPYREHDDARPTIVEEINDKIISVFSGKIPTCVEAAEQVLKIAKKKVSKKDLKVGIIGIGKWGENLVRVFNENSHVVMCSNKENIHRRHALKEKYPNIKITSDYNEILNDTSIDAVVIATPIKTHFEIGKNALRKKENIFLEKPIAKNVEDAKKLIKLSNDKILFIGHIFLYHPCYKKLKELTANDRIVDLKLNWNKFGTFHEDIFLNLVSQELSIAYGLLDKNLAQIKLKKSKGIISSSDVVSLDMKFQKGGKCEINIDRTNPNKVKEVKIITEKDNVYYWVDDKIFKLNKRERKFEVIFKSKEEPLHAEVKDFLKYVREESEPTTNKKIALKVLETIEKIKALV